MKSDRQWDELLAGLRSGDDDACAKFWNAYGPLLESVAEKQLSGRVQRRVGSDDIVQSVCRTFFRRVSEGQFDLPDTEALWRLICSITLNKARRAARNQSRQKRGIDREQDIDANADGGTAPSANLEANVPTPFDAAELADQMQALLSDLGEQECAILDLKLQQFTNDEIAEKIGCSERTVRRIIKRLQETWLRMEEDL
jgi:RNA polymerase sigma factor (sigma-70 family)